MSSVVVDGSISFRHFCPYIKTLITGRSFPSESPEARAHPPLPSPMPPGPALIAQPSSAPCRGVAHRALQAPVTGVTGARYSRPLQPPVTAARYSRPAVTMRPLRRPALTNEIPFRRLNRPGAGARARAYWALQQDARYSYGYRPSRWAPEPERTPIGRCSRPCLQHARRK